MSAKLKSEVVSFLAQDHRALIGYEWAHARSRETLDVLDPATGEAIARVPACDEWDIDIAVRAARDSFDKGVWRGLASAERTRILLHYADLIDAHAIEIAQIDVVDNGMPIWLAKAVVANSSSGLRYAAMLAATMPDLNLSGVTSSPGSSLHAYTASGPIGVVGLITPWNGPAPAFLIKVAPALAAGCSCVVKPAENTPLSALYLGKLAMDAGVPPGVLSVVTGLGRTAGEALVDHPQVDKISFTGSTQVGKRIVQRAADSLKRVTLELGGKSPCIVFDDADLETAIPAAAMGVFINSGQICIAASRLFVHRKIYDTVVSGVAQVGRSLKIGNGLIETSQLGPVISAIHRERIHSFLQESRGEGAEIVSGGGAPSGPGFFVEPTVLANVNRNARIAKEEVFGPVLVATPFDDVAEVIRLANDTRYGLAAGIFTRDVNKAHKVAGQLDAGNVWVNCYGITHPLLPFGGIKESGWGREFGMDGIDAYRIKKSVAIQLT